MSKTQREWIFSCCTIAEILWSRSLLPDISILKKIGDGCVIAAYVIRHAYKDLLQDFSQDLNSSFVLESNSEYIIISNRRTFICAFWTITVNFICYMYSISAYICWNEKRCSLSELSMNLICKAFSFINRYGRMKKIKLWLITPNVLLISFTSVAILSSSYLLQVLYIKHANLLDLNIFKFSKIQCPFKSKIELK